MEDTKSSPKTQKKPFSRISLLIFLLLSASILTVGAAMVLMFFHLAKFFWVMNLVFVGAGLFVSGSVILLARGIKNFLNNRQKGSTEPTQTTPSPLPAKVEANTDTNSTPKTPAVHQPNGANTDLGASASSSGTQSGEGSANRDHAHSTTSIPDDIPEDPQTDISDKTKTTNEMITGTPKPGKNVKAFKDDTLNSPHEEEQTEFFKTTPEPTSQLQDNPVTKEKDEAEKGAENENNTLTEPPHQSTEQNPEAALKEAQGPTQGTDRSLKEPHADSDNPTRSSSLQPTENENLRQSENEKPNDSESKQENPESKQENLTNPSETDTGKNKNASENTSPPTEEVSPEVPDESKKKNSSERTPKNNPSNEQEKKDEKAELDQQKVILTEQMNKNFEEARKNLTEPQPNTRVEDLEKWNAKLTSFQKELENILTNSGSLTNSASHKSPPDTITSPNLAPIRDIHRHIKEYLNLPHTPNQCTPIPLNTEEKKKVYSEDNDNLREVFFFIQETSKLYYFNADSRFTCLGEWKDGEKLFTEALAHFKKRKELHLRISKMRLTRIQSLHKKISKRKISTQENSISSNFSPVNSPSDTNMTQKKTHPSPALTTPSSPLQSTKPSSSLGETEIKKTQNSTIKEKNSTSHPQKTTVALKTSPSNDNRTRGRSNTPTYKKTNQKEPERAQSLTPKKGQSSVAKTKKISNSTGKKPSGTTPNQNKNGDKLTRGRSKTLTQTGQARSQSVTTIQNEHITTQSDNTPKTPGPSTNRSQTTSNNSLKSPGRNGQFSSQPNHKKTASTQNSQRVNTSPAISPQG